MVMVHADDYVCWRDDSTPTVRMIVDRARGA
jgi:hypothetical protein